MRKAGLYGLAAVASFVLFFIVQAPAPLLMMLVDDTLAARAPGLTVSNVAGSLWNGEATIQQTGLTPSQVQWQISPAAILSGRLAADLNAAGLDHALSGRVTWQPAQLTLEQLEGRLGSSYLNPLARPYGLQFSGQLDIDELQAAFTPQSGWFSNAAGSAHWSGGQVRFAGDAGAQSVQLPAMTAELSQADTDLQLMVTSDAQQLLSVVLKPTGWVAVSLKQALFQIAGIQLPPGATLSEDSTGQPSSNTVVELEEKLF